MAKRALLILIGGRQAPNVLAAQCLRPDIIAPIASHEAMRSGSDWEKVSQILRQLCPGGLKKPAIVNGESHHETFDACLRVLLEYLYKLDSVASLVGGSYVGRLLIASRKPPADPNQQK